MTRIYTAAIIGAGRIGSGFDSPRSREILTHAHAIVQNPHLELVALVDKDAIQGKREAKRWETPFYKDLRKMFKKEKPDIVVIATPDETHVRMLLEVARRKPRLIVCEKPIATDTRQARRIKEYRVPVIVNLSRRFDESMVELRAALLEGRYGKVLSASGIYTKGIFHNGSHMIDLTRFLFGEMIFSAAHFQKRDWEGDPSVGGVATFERCLEFHLQLADARAYAIFELDILAEKMRIRITDEGRTILTEQVIVDPMYKGFRILGKAKSEKTHLDRALPALYAHAIDVLEKRSRSHSSLEEALKTGRTCARFARGYKRL